MKTINYTGTSKLITRIVNLLNRKAPLPLDGDGDAEWGTSGQVLTTDGNGNTSWTNKGGGGGGSTVSYTQTLVSGTKTGEIEIDGVSTNMYAPTPPTNTSDLNNDSGFIDSTDLSTALADYTPTANLATVATSGSYNDLSNKPTIPAAQVNSDWNAVSGVAQILNKPSLATVATSGSYNDLTNKPTIPAAQIQSDWSQADNTKVDYIKNKPSLAAVATSGSYSDLSGTPNLTNVAYNNVDNSFTVNQTINRNNGTVSDVGGSYIILGNNIPSGTAKNSRGVVRLFGTSDKYAQIYDNGVLTANRNLNLPDKSGTIALTSDIPTVTKTVFYGTCTGQAANQTKAIVVDSSQGFALTAGIILFVKFDANNTYSATAEAPVKLNVNSTGAMNIYYGASNAPTGTNTTVFGRANYVNQYYYDGTDWVWSGSSADNNTTYSNMSANELTTGTATTGRSISAKVLNDWNTAAHTSYSNTTSGLSATNVQSAVDELDTKVDTITSSTDIAAQITSSNLVNLDYVTVSNCFKYGKLLILNVTCAITTPGSPISFKLNFPGTINPVSMSFMGISYSGWTPDAQVNVSFISDGAGRFISAHSPGMFMQFNVVIPYTGD